MDFREQRKVGKPFDVVIIGPPQGEGAITKTIAKSFTQSRELRGFFLHGGYGSRNQH